MIWAALAPAWLKRAVAWLSVALVAFAGIRGLAKRDARREAAMMTDQAYWYRPLGKEFASHEAVDHGKDEYVRGNVHTNTIEGYFSILKRGMKGVYQHCGKKHLHRYMAEFDFRYSNRAALDVSDTMRADLALQSVVGKRLTYAQ